MKKLLTLIVASLMAISALFMTACGGKVIEVNDQLSALTEVQAGTSDIAVIDSVMAGYYVSKDNFDDLMILDGEDFTFESEYYAIGTRKDTNTADYINFALYMLQEDGTIEEIAEKYGLEDVIVEIPEPENKNMDLPEEGTDFAEIMENGKLVLGYTIFEPIAYEDEDGELIGFDIELAKAVCEGFDLELVCEKINWDTKEDELNNKNIDLIWNGFTYTEERAENINFTDFYMLNRQAIVIRKADADKYKSYADMKGAKFVCESESAGQTTIEEIILPKTKA
jgi:polar amino acid transport system substrate-binding protein